MDRAANTSPRKLLELAEEEDGYRAAVAASVPNRLARQGHEYIPFFIDQGAADRLAIEVGRIGLLKDASVIVMHPSAENGMPHTRPLDIVCLPATYVETATRPELADTLRHEAVHLHQRRHPDAWNTRSRRDGWTPIADAAASIPAQYRLACRLNPDTFRAPAFWAWEDFFVPLPLLIPKPAPTLHDCEVRWLDMRVGGGRSSRSLLSEPPPSFTRRYGPQPPQPEHPFELLAVECAAAGVSTPQQIERYLRS